VHCGWRSRPGATSHHSDRTGWLCRAPRPSPDRGRRTPHRRLCRAPALCRWSHRAPCRWSNDVRRREKRGGGWTSTRGRTSMRPRGQSRGGGWTSTRGRTSTRRRGRSRGGGRASTRGRTLARRPSGAVVDPPTVVESTAVGSSVSLLLLLSLSLSSSMAVVRAQHKMKEDYDCSNCVFFCDDRLTS